jgi:hypothetical protein
MMNCDFARNALIQLEDKLLRRLCVATYKPWRQRIEHRGYAGIDSTNRSTDPGWKYKVQQSPEKKQS